MTPSLATIDLTRLKWLPQRIENVLIELRRFIEEQNASVGQ